jgi:hypothetical protein
MRWVTKAAMVLVALAAWPSNGHAGPAIACADDAVPIETLGSDKEQRQSRFNQANACVQQGKPARAVALLSQIIKADPADAVAYLKSWQRPGKRGRGGACRQRLQRRHQPATRSYRSLVRPRHNLHAYAPLRQRHRRLHRGDPAQARFRARLLQPGLGECPARPLRRRPGGLLGRDRSRSQAQFLLFQSRQPVFHLG